MLFILYAAGLLFVSGLCALFLNRFDKFANATGALGVMSACVIGLFSLFRYFRGIGSMSLSLPWPVPYGSFSIAIDSLAIVFLFPIFILCALCALYGMQYLTHYFGKKNIGSAWFFFNLLAASMIFVVVSRNVMLFLTAWEVMSVSSFFLVLFEGEKEEVRKAGFIYLVATHIGTLFLLVMFLLLARGSGSFDFFHMGAGLDGITQSVIFLLAVVGFGTKAGFMPMHIWLPEAHPAAPSHVSAVMSAVMIKTGIYGLLRILMFLNAPCVWWGWLLIIIGAVSGILGVLFALAQQDLKRLLAYSSIENIGIITMAIGLGVLGLSTGNSILVVFGFAGALLHILNHAFFKGLLFLAAGAVLHETGTRKMDILGGLFKKMPVTGFCFLVGAAAICGLPPLNGFASEFLIYLGSLKSIFGVKEIVFASLLVIACLSFIGALAVACFTKAFGIIFLGEARGTRGRTAHEAGIFMRAAMVILAGFCFAVGLAAPFILVVLNNVISEFTGIPFFVIEANLSMALGPMIGIVIISVCLLAVILLMVKIRRKLLEGRKVETAPTWGCGYVRSSCRMQYSASSFSQPLVEFFKGVLRLEKHGFQPRGYFPGDSSFRTETVDLFHGVVYRRLLGLTRRLAKRLTWFQQGQLQLYILYILIALLALLIWKL